MDCTLCHGTKIVVSPDTYRQFELCPECYIVPKKVRETMQTFTTFEIKDSNLASRIFDDKNRPGQEEDTKIIYRISFPGKLKIITTNPKDEECIRGYLEGLTNG